MANRGRELKGLGQVLVNDPRSFPAGLLKLIKRSVRTVWDARGGGLYACGFLITFVFLEIRMFFVDIYEAESVSGYFSSQASEILFKYIGESFQNTISAFMWPVYVIEVDATWGAMVLAALFIIFPRFIKEPLENWLFREDDV